MAQTSVAATTASNDNKSVSISPPVEGASKFKKFELEYDEAGRIYSPGDVINGRLILECFETETDLELTLEWLGEARVQLSNSLNEKHLYLNGSQELLSRKSNKTLSAGHHEFLFSITLPNHIPSTYFSSRPAASISYKTAVTAKKPQILIDAKVEKEFLVRGTHDLREHKECLLPQELSQNCQICCYGCSSNPIGYIVKLEKTGFMPGESINFVVELFNRSRKNSKANLKFSLLERTVFWAQGKSEQGEDRIVTEIPGPKLDSKNKEIVQSFIFEIPNLMIHYPSSSSYVHPSLLGGCRLITLTYFFKVTLKVPCRDSKSLEQRIHIGSIPHTVTNSPPPLKDKVKVVAICTSRDPDKSVNLSANSCNY